VWGRARQPETYDDLVGQVADYAIVGLDPQGIIQTWNLGAERVKGYTAEEAVGRSFSMFYRQEDRDSGLPQEILKSARLDGRVEHIGWRVRKDGTQFWGDVVVTALHDDEGRLTGYVKVTRDLTEQHDLEVALRTSEERLRLLVGQVSDYAIIALDTDGTIQTWNLGAEQVKGYTAEEAIGCHFSMFYTEEDRRRGLPARMLAVAAELGRVEQTGWRVRKDGTLFWGDVVITALHDEAGELTGYAKVTRDRTNVKTLEDAQDAFYAAFNHDFRTPVTALKGFVDALREARDDEREHLINRVEASADRLLTMVEGLVEFATSRAGHAPLMVADIDVAQVVRSAVQDLPPDLDASRVQVPDDVVLGRANGVAMHRVLTNLLLNALKYSPSDMPVEVTFNRPRPDHVGLTVTDHGRGIDPGDVGTIFDEFVRGRLAQDDGGTGMGLASARELVEQQAGSITLETELGVGTTVNVELPSTRMLKASAPAQRTGSSPAVSVPLSGPLPGRVSPDSATARGLRSSGSSSPTGQSSP
jgi:PAS domain S-box-containing protein